ncbi:kinase-like protein, partial [Fragilariopsis cylindrus CCMP1102]
ICRQLSDALEYIHSNAIVYRDLKPSNIGFLSTTNETPVHVKLLDFVNDYPSLSTCNRSALSPKTNTSYDMTGLVGTMRYMAPEVCLNQRYGLECDIYSWSIVAYGILTKRTPFEDMTPDMYQVMVCRGDYRPPI